MSNEGDATSAFNVIKLVLSYPERVNETAVFGKTLCAFVPIAQSMTGDELGDIVQEASTLLDNPDTLHHLGGKLMKYGLSDFVATVLACAFLDAR